MENRAHPHRRWLLRQGTPSLIDSMQTLGVDVSIVGAFIPIQMYSKYSGASRFMSKSIFAPQRGGGASMRSGDRQREDRSLRGLDDADESH